MLAIKNRPPRSKTVRDRSKKFNKFLYYFNWVGYNIWFARRQIRFASLTLTSSISMFLYTSNYHLVLAEDTPGGNDGGGGTCAGFLCGAIDKIVTTPPYDANAEMIRAVFIGANAIIVAFLAWRVVKVLQARDAGEEYQSIASNAVLTVVALLIVNYFADYVMGVGSVEN